MKQLSFFNTTLKTGVELQAAIQNAKNQKEKILVLFKNNPNSNLSPEQVHEHLFATQSTPLTSTRRAISVLTKAGKLIKTSEMVMGSYGEEIHTWKLAKS